MDPNEYDKKMRRGEIYHGQRVPDGMRTIVRLDGRTFHKYTAKYAKPFDKRFAHLMAETARACLQEFGALYAYTQSDEISLVLPSYWADFDREVEKTVSLTAAYASAFFTHASRDFVQFDSRLWVGWGQDDVVDYLRWRQADAERNALNGAAYWSLREAGMSASGATGWLRGKPRKFKHDVLHDLGRNYDLLMAWEKRGIGVRWEHYVKDGVDPRDGTHHATTRRRVLVDWELPYGEAYTDYIREHLSESATHRTTRAA